MVPAHESPLMAVPIVSVKTGLPVGQGRIRLIPASD